MRSAAHRSHMVSRNTQRVIVAAACVALSVVVAACPSPVNAQTLETQLSQALRNNGVVLSIDGGRIVIDGDRVVNSQANVTTGASEEDLTVRCENGIPQLTYHRTTANEKIVFEIAGNHLTIRRIPKDKNAVVPVEFVQIPNEKITLTVGANGRQVALDAAGFWQLLIAHPQVCKQHLIPLLELARPDWKLAETAAKAEEILLSGSDNDAVAKRMLWAELVEQLGDDRFAKREAADRALRNADPSVLSYLRQLDFRRLDAEQQFRVRRIVETLSGQMSDDSPEQAAAMLAGDPAVWLALLERPEVATRRIAARQLTALLGEPIPVDPEAEPSTQQARRELLQSRIDGKER
jgi:hypothetical protein